MKKFALYILLSQAIICFVSCEKDFIYDDDCVRNNGGNQISNWGNGEDSTIIHKQDTTGGFDIDIDQWGDTTKTDIPIK